MADDGSEQSKIWPLPKFHFSVKVGDKSVPFQEVTGLDTETDPIEYRAGNSKVFSTIKMPGMIKNSNITLKKGIFKGDNDLFKWFSEIKMNLIARKTVIISLLDEGGNDTMVWTATNAFPVKIQGTELKADGNEVAVETIELAHEGLTIKNG